MALSPNALQRDRVLVQARDTGDRYEAPTSNSALALAQSLRSVEPAVSATLGQIAEKDAIKKRAAGRRAALLTQGSTLAEAVRQGKIKPTQNPWFMEAYAKESGAIRAQSAFTQLQLDSTTWAERNDPQAFAAKWSEGVAKIAEGFTDPNELAGFNPVQSQFTQQTLQSNTAENVQRITSERKQNVSSLAAQALQTASSTNGGTLTADQALAALAPSREMWLTTGGTEEEWHKLTVTAITTAAYAAKNPGLIDLSRAIGLDGTAVLDGTFGSGTEPVSLVPTPQAPAPVLAGDAPEGHPLAPKFRFPFAGINARVTDDFGVRRGASTHNGIDLAVPEGTPVVAPGIGKVVEVGHDAHSRSGIYVKVDHGNGLVSSYAHLEHASVREGDRVAPGSILGAAGQTGHATGPHVHWVTRQGGQVVNPRSVKFPQGAVAEAAAQVAPAQAPPQPQGEDQPPADQAAPQPQVARGPSLYDIAGVADTAESDRYRITQAQEDALTHGLQVRRAQVAEQAQAATDYLYAQHGTDILLGNYDVPALVKELTAQNYPPQVIQEALHGLDQGVGSSASLMHHRMEINGSDPARSKAIMDLAVEGERNGYSEDYERRVGEAVLRGDISGDEGTRFVGSSLSRTRQQQSESRAQANFDRQQEAAQPGTIHNYTQLKQRGEGLAAVAAQSYTKFLGRAPGDIERKRAKGIITDAMAAWLVTNPGDFAGAFAAGQQAVADYAARLQAGHSRATPGAARLPSQSALAIPGATTPRSH